MERVLRALIHIYQKYVSPLTPPSCRFSPTCSAYAYTAVRRFGAAKGSWLAVKRIARCRPGGKTGYDPVPEVDKAA